MNDVIAGILEDTSKKFNKDVVEGTAKDILESVPGILDGIIKDSILSLSDKVPLEYKGYRLLTAKEEFNKLFPPPSSKSKSQKIMFDLAKSDFYMIELIFNYNGMEIRRHLYLPYAERGNLVDISGTKYHIVPVLSDTVISPSHKEVFVRLLKDKLTFKSSTKAFIVNGERVPGQLIYSKIAKTNVTAAQDRIGKPLPAISLYPLSTYGLNVTMKKYLAEDLIITTDKDVADKYSSTHDIYESTKARPWGYKEYAYKGHDLKILAPKDTNSPLVENFIYGIIYTFDILPEHLDDFLEIYADNDVKQEKMFWKIMLGRVIYANSVSVDRIVNDMNEHFEMLRGYIDEVIKGKLKELNFKINNFSDLIMVMLQNYNQWLINSKEFNSDINNRYIDILYYILYNLIIVSFNRVVMTINKRASKRELTNKEVQKIFNDELKKWLIFKLVKSSAMNIAINLCDSTVDIMYPKITALLEDQSRGHGVTRAKNAKFPESTKSIHGQDLILGNVLFLTKSAPSPRFRVNPYLQYDVSSGKIKYSTKIKRSTDKLEDMIQGKIVNNDNLVTDNELDTEEMSQLD